MNPVSPIPPISGFGNVNPIQPSGVAPAGNDSVKESGGSNLFKGFLESANLDQQSSDQAVKDLVEGKAGSVQEVVMAVAKAEMSFQLFMEIRNHLIDSYNELMRMSF
ncbi:flagellar hook-basal body complex protein FliE [Mariniblastus fucicola]|uniref:Flagellar hook-basal body complex protein FliE n=1 Tax=Mariniblastus fucicola TaxID=980251 RepID=A0A5B9PM49_9BACT|nr:flagellar hook-basal body complex protein FliE [Mariniblastus fucicola]QEG23373.1 flagellar hook-basal body protein FliE [Mariniblastus fucicola]